MPTATVIPVLVYPDVRAAVAWLADAFGFVERVRIGADHRAQLSIGADGAVIVADDDRSLADAELRAVALADPDSLDEPERSGQPVDRLAHVRVDEHRDDLTCRNGAVGLHAAASLYASIRVPARALTAKIRVQDQGAAPM